MSVERADIAIIWQRFGPYHRARLEAVAASWNNPRKVVGFEIAAADHYPWQARERPVSFRHHCCFPGENYLELPKLAIAASVWRALNRFDPQSVAINGWSAVEALVALAWCRWRKRQAILMSETHRFGRASTPVRDIPKRVVVRLANAGLVGGRWHADYLAALGMPADHIRLGYDTVDNDHFARGADLARSHPATYRQRFALPPRYVFACTRFLERKNIDGLLQAFRAYKDRRPAGGLALVIAGGGEEELVLKELQRTLDLNDVHWPGFVSYDDLPVYYGLAEAFIHPAKSEAWGLVVNEAAAAGAPLLIASTVGACCELVRDGWNGCSFDPDDHLELSKLIARVETLDRQNANSMSENSRELIARFSTRAFVEGLTVPLERPMEALNFENP